MAAITTSRIVLGTEDLVSSVNAARLASVLAFGSSNAARSARVSTPLKGVAFPGLIELGGHGCLPELRELLIAGAADAAVLHVDPNTLLVGLGQLAIEMTGEQGLVETIGTCGAHEAPPAVLPRTSSASRRRARWSRDITVPRGIPST